jgi:type IV secretory pathway VirB3-like protein
VQILGSTPWGTPFILTIPTQKKTNLSNQCHFEGRAPMIFGLLLFSIVLSFILSNLVLFFYKNFCSFILVTIVFFLWSFFAS